VLQNSAIGLVVEAARAVVPDLGGRTTDDARSLLAAAGLQIGAVTEQVTGAPAGSVLQQDPVAGTAVLHNSAVKLVVEAPRAVVPNVLGKTRADAQSALTASLLQLGSVTEQLTGSPPGSGAPAGAVVGQTPAAGGEVLRGSAVQLVLEPTTVVVPEVRGRSQADATALLTNAGLRLGSVSQQQAAASSGTVLAEDPPAGSQVALRSAVGLVVQAPPPPMLSNLSITFHTNNDDKDNDTGVQVRIGTAAEWHQTSNQVFPDNSDVTKVFSPSQVRLSDVQGQSFSICISPNGNDTWRFNYILAGTRDDGSSYVVSDSSLVLTQDRRCFSRTLP